MIDTEWFWIKKDPAAPFVKTTGFGKNKFPYFTDAEAFASVDDSVIYYDREKFSPCDFLFEPTFLIIDRLKPLFELLEPAIEYKGVQLYRKIYPEYSKIFQGKVSKLVLNYSALRGKRVAHCKSPADDIWLLSLEAAECFLRRQPVGVLLEKIPNQP